MSQAEQDDPEASYRPGYQAYAVILLAAITAACSIHCLCNLRIEKPYVKRRKAYLLQSRQVS
jgi:hypothetical protein